MTLAMVLGAMALLAALFVAAPLMARPAPPRDRAAFDRAVFRDQLAEVERDLERGVIGEADAAAARTEIERRLLRAAGEGTADSVGGETMAGSGQATRRPSRLARALMAALVAAVPVAAGGLYLALGAPGMPDQPAARRVAERAPLKALSDAELAGTVARIEKRLEDRPGEIQGWIILSTAYLRLGRADDADRALDRAMALAAGDGARAARIALDFGETLTAMNGGRIVPRALAAFERARALSPDDPSVRYYLGLARLQAGETAAGLSIWRRLLADAPTDADWRESLRESIERIAAERNIDLESLDGPDAPGNR